MNKILLCAVGMLLSFSIAAQNIDADLKRAIDFYQNGELDKAKRLSQAALEKYPDYHDFRLVLARVYLKENNYDAARKELRTITNATTDYPDAYMLLIDAELAANNPEGALTASQEALKHYDEREVLYKQAAAYGMMQDCDRAIDGIDRLREQYPEDESLDYLKNRAQANCIDNWVFLTYYYSFFSPITNENAEFEAWQTGELEFLHETEYVDIIPRWNFAPTQGMASLFELDLYPKIRKGKTYGYLNAGYSPGDKVWPRFKAGAEIFQSIFTSWEISAGARYRVMKDPNNVLDASDRDLWLITGSLSKYLPHGLLANYRHYYAPAQNGADEGFHSQALSLSWYMEGHKYSYLRLTLFNGNYYDVLSGQRFVEARFPEDPDVTFNASGFQLGSKGVNLYLQKLLTKGWAIRALAGYERDEYGFRNVINGNEPERLERHKYNLGAGIGYMF